MNKKNEQGYIHQNQNLEVKYDETPSLLNSTLNAIREGILVVNLQGKIVFFNKKFLEIWSVPEEIIKERNDEKILAYVFDQLKDPVNFINKVNQLYSTPEAESHDLLEFKDGRIIERFSQSQIFNNTSVGRVWSFIDITDKIIAEENLMKEKDLLQALLDNIPDSIYFKDTESKFTRCNDAQAKLHFGISDPKDAIGKSDFDFFEIDHAAAAYEDEQKIIQSKLPLIAKEERIRNADGDHIWVTATKVPIINQQGQCIGLVGISRDITASKLAEEKLEKYSNALKELNASKDKLFSIIAHDLRGPFNPLLGLSEILVNDFETFSQEEIKDYIKEIYSLLKNEYNLLENLLNWSRLETDNMKLNPEKINLYNKTESVINLLSENAKLKKIELLNETHKDIFISADPTMLHSILQNLIANSIKFTNRDGSIRIDSIKTNNNFIIITVSDNGVGMTEAQTKELFGLNTKSTKGTNDEKGTGLGLLICKEFVEMNNGKIWVESKLGIGSKFYFTLPKEKL